MGELVRGNLRLKTIVGAGSALIALAVTTPAMLASTSAHAAAPVGPVALEVADFYRSRGGAPLWFGPNAGAAAPQLLQLLATSQADHLNPRRYNLRGIQRAIAEAQSRNPAAIQRAEMMLSTAFVTYAQDLKHDPGVGVVYVDRELKPNPPSASELLTAASHSSSLSDYVQQMRWMNPIYAKLRQALASRVYSNPAQYRLLSLNLERARALPSGNGRFVIVNPPAIIPFFIQ